MFGDVNDIKGKSIPRKILLVIHVDGETKRIVWI